MEEDILGDTVAVGDANEGSRIRKRAEKEQRGKRGKYQDPDPDLKNFSRPCSHNNKTYQCQKVKISDIKTIRRRLYEVSDKNVQDMKLCHMISVSGTVRKRPVKDSPRQRTRAANFFLKIKNERLTADRVFGRMEKIFRKKPTIISKEEYIGYYSQVGSVKVLGQDWQIFNIKELQNYFNKISGISDLKRISLKKTRNQKTGEIKISMACFQHYRYEAQSEVSKSVYKRGKTLSNFLLSEVQLRDSIPQKKIQSVRQLMEKQFGKEWETDPNFEWYRKLLGKDRGRNNEEIGHEEDDMRMECDCLEEETALHI
ncbi:unnamed protein product [Psylliodes chrysocephalus]|uniref:Uncharacterized protein n=1 Tax=Psylliodes chrysocephalus TaxID=3402493 RepID=A0A9P0D160_9CUCU|nr:unnamed protein product [Psylliodes chrysocephala]